MPPPMAVAAQEQHAEQVQIPFDGDHGSGDGKGHRAHDLNEEKREIHSIHPICLLP